MTEKSHKKDTKQSKEVQELKEIVQRVQADFENYKKRVEKERKELIDYATEGLIKKFLPIMDNLELALTHAKAKDEFYKGVELIYASIREMLADEGVNAITSIGLPFDPYKHEALMQKESDKPTQTIIEEMQKGYTIKERVIRPSKVIVSKGGEKNE